VLSGELPPRELEVEAPDAAGGSGHVWGRGSEADLFRGKTPSEISWLKKKREKDVDKIKKKAEKSHQEKVMKFNEGLNKLSEHYDIPKVSWTK
jgi:hypothetical protein